MSETIDQVECPSCSGNVEFRAINDNVSVVCIGCGKVINSEDIVLEEQMPDQTQENHEIMQ